MNNRCVVYIVTVHGRKWIVGPRSYDCTQVLHCAKRSDPNEPVRLSLTQMLSSSIFTWWTLCCTPLEVTAASCKFTLD